LTDAGSITTGLNRERSGLSESTSTIAQVQESGCADTEVGEPGDGVATLLAEVDECGSGGLAGREDAQEVWTGSSNPVEESGQADNNAQRGVDGVLSKRGGGEGGEDGEVGKEGLHD
jgi:hypothetical protein